MSGRVFCLCFSPLILTILICTELTFPYFEPILPVMTIGLPMSFFLLLFLLAHGELSHLTFSHWAAGEGKCKSSWVSIWQPAKAKPTTCKDRGFKYEAELYSLLKTVL